MTLEEAISDFLRKRESLAEKQATSDWISMENRLPEPPKEGNRLCL